MPSLCYYTFFVRHLNAKYLSHWYTDCESWMRNSFSRIFIFKYLEPSCFHPSVLSLEFLVTIICSSSQVKQETYCLQHLFCQVFVNISISYNQGSRLFRSHLICLSVGVHKSYVNLLVLSQLILFSWSKALKTSLLKPNIANTVKPLIFVRWKVFYVFYFMKETF